MGKQYHETLFKGVMGENVAFEGMEMHALSSAAKPVCSWAARDGIQDCREACGGHGYLKAAQLGDLRNDNDANTTYEGENNVLVQQTSNWLLNTRKKGGYKAFKEASPFGSADFLTDFDQLIKRKFNFGSAKEVMEPKCRYFYSFILKNEHLIIFSNVFLDILTVLDSLCAYQLDKTAKHCDELLAQRKSAFEVRNESQALYAITLSCIYGQRMVFKKFYETVLEWTDIPSEQSAMMQLVSLFGLEMIRKYLGILYEAGFISGAEPTQIVQNAILLLLPEIKINAISLVDAMAPPDFLLNSPLGMSDGNVYKHLQNTIMSAPGALARPYWWKDVVAWQDPKGKL